LARYVKNVDVLHKDKKEENLQLPQNEGRLTGLVTSRVGTAF